MEREEFRDLGVRDEGELARMKAEVSSSSLYNEDLAPTGFEERTWTTYNIAALWIGMSVVITTYLPGFFNAATTAGLNGRPFPNPTYLESLYNYGLFLTFTVSGLLYLGLSMIGGRAAEPAREPETT